MNATLRIKETLVDLLIFILDPFRGLLKRTGNRIPRKAAGLALGLLLGGHATTALAQVTPGMIGTDQTVCAGGTPAPLTNIAGATGGTGTYAYQWESSADNINWTPVAGATGETFAPGPLTATTYFRRRVTSGFCASAISSVVTLMVRPILASRAAAATSAFVVYPNPSNSGRLHLPLQLSGPGHATLLNALGQAMLTKDLSGTADQTLITSGLAPGVYTLCVATADRILTGRVVLE